MRRPTWPRLFTLCILSGPDGIGTCARRAEGLTTSVIELLGCELAVPDRTTVSRRAIKLPSIARAARPDGPLHVVIDSTGLKVYGTGR